MSATSMRLARCLQPGLGKSLETMIASHVLATNMTPAPTDSGLVCSQTRFLVIVEPCLPVPPTRLRPPILHDRTHSITLMEGWAFN